MMSRGVMWFLLLLMPVMNTSCCLSEPPQNATRWELLEAIADQIHLEPGLMIRTPEYYRYYLWNHYKTSPRSQRLEILKEMSEDLKEIALRDRRIDMLGLILFGAEKGPSFLRLRYHERPEPLNVTDHLLCLDTIDVLYEKHCGPISFMGLRHINYRSNVCYLASTAAIEEAFILTCGINIIEPVPQQQVPYRYLALGTGLSFMAPFASKEILDQYADDNAVARLLTRAMRVLVVTSIFLVSYVDSPSSATVAVASCLALALNHVIGSIISSISYKKAELPWEKFTDGWTSDQVVAWASSPGFKAWLIKNYHRIIVLPDTSQDE